MNESQAFTNEMMFKALLSKSNESVDMLQLVASVLEDIEKGVKQANDGISAVKKETEEINSKIDIVLEKLNDLQSSFEEIKN